jgi:hypothetical protein
MADFAMAASAQMACCEASHDQCPMHGTAADCCKVEGQRQQQVWVAAHEFARLTFSAPALVAAIFPPLFPLTVEKTATARLASHLDLLESSSPPRYLLGSVFLI